MKSLLFSVVAILALNIVITAQPMVMPMQRSEHLVFVENKGQITDQTGAARPDIDFRLSSGNINVFIGKGQIHYQWVAPKNATLAITDVLGKSFNAEEAPLVDIYRMDLQLLDAKVNGVLVKEGRQPYVEKYYLPQCGPEGATVQSYEKIVYKEIYPHIDWVLYIKNGKLEQDFIVYPGGNVADIRMQFKGATGLGINEDGSFTATTPFGSISEAAPYSFQEDGKEVTSAFVLSHNELGFDVATFNGRLTIDPTVSWATYLGGNGMFDIFEDMELSVHNDVYVGGTTFSASNIATAGAHQVTLQGPNDVVLKKFTKDGDLLWATYYGGESEELFSALSCDSVGNVYISGRSLSATGIATAGSYQPDFIENGDGMDAFVAKFDSSGSRLWGTYFGGPGIEDYVKIAVKGDAFFISGVTSSTTGIASATAHQTSIGDPLGADIDFFLAKFSLDGEKAWSTYYGGPGIEPLANAIACDDWGNIYLFGATSSESGIATPGAHKSIYTFVNGAYDHFLAKFNKDGVRQWATYYGGDGMELGMVFPRNIACDPFGNIYMTGTTASTNAIASSESYQSQLSGGDDAYLVKFDSNGVRQWATYYGGPDAEFGASVHIVDSYSVYINGSTNSAAGIASPNALQQVYAGGIGYGDAFLARFSDEGELLYSSYFGGQGADAALAAAVDTGGYVYIAGFTNSTTDIATAGSYKSSYPGGVIADGFLAKFCFAAPASILDIQGADSICRESVAAYSVAEVPDADAYIWTLPDGWNGSSNNNTIDITADQQSGIIGVQVVRCGDTSEVAQFPVYVYPPEPAVITVDNFTLGTVGTYASYQWLLNDQLIPGATAASITVAENGDYRVITVNEKGCTDTSAIYTVSNVGINDMAGLAMQINIFPNPTTGKVFIQSPAKLFMTLTTIEGRVLTEFADEEVIDLSDYATGVYMLRLTTTEGRWIRTEKVIKIQ